MNGVIEIFRGMSKKFRICMYAFIYLKVTSNISAPDDPIIHFYYGKISPNESSFHGISAGRAQSQRSEISP